MPAPDPAGLTSGAEPGAQTRAGHASGAVDRSPRGPAGSGDHAERGERPPTSTATQRSGCCGGPSSWPSATPLPAPADGISEQALVEAAEELGVDVAAVRRAAAEERLGVLLEARRRTDWIGWSDRQRSSATRVVGPHRGRGDRARGHVVAPQRHAAASSAGRRRALRGDLHAPLGPGRRRCSAPPGRCAARSTSGASAGSASSCSRSTRSAAWWRWSRTWSSSARWRSPAARRSPGSGSAVAVVEALAGHAVAVARACRRRSPPGSGCCAGARARRAGRRDVRCRECWTGSSARDRADRRARRRPRAPAAAGRRAGSAARPDGAAHAAPVVSRG